MTLVRALSLSVAAGVIMLLIGCGGTSDDVLFQSITERASWSVDNFLAFSSFGGNGQKYIYRSTQFGGRQVLLTTTDNDSDFSDEGGWHPAHSPDGAQIAFAARRDGGSTAICLMDGRDGDRNGLTRLTSKDVAGEDIQPNWKPDGTQIVFATDKTVAGGGTGSLDIAVINADGTGLQYFVVSNESEQWPTFNPAGTSIAYQLGPKDGPTDIVIRDIALGTDTNLTQALRTGPGDITRFECPAWGLIGTEEWIYFHSNRDGDFDLFRIRPAGADLQQITNDPRSDGFPIISPHGDRILFTRDRELWARDPGPGDGNERRITRRY